MNSENIGNCLFKLSKILLPILTASTIDEKSSFKRTSDEASLATSVPRLPILIPMWAALMREHR